MSEYGISYEPIPLSLIPPIINEETLDILAANAEIALESWWIYNDADVAKRALLKDITGTNIDNLLSHSIASNLPFDANKLHRSLRPQDAIYYREEGVKSVEVDARLIGSSDEPHNPLTTTHTFRVLNQLLKQSEWKKEVASNPRTRFKVTRAVEEGDNSFLIVRTKVDQLAFENTKTGTVHGLKGRRSGYVDLSKVDDQIIDDIELVKRTDEVLENDKALTAARENVRGYFLQEPLSYQAVVDRVYITSDHTKGV